MQPSGNLSDISLPSLFHKIRISKTTGALRLTQGQMIKEIYFLNGRPIYVKSNVLSETLGRVLLNSGFISQDVYDKSLAIMQATKRQQGEILKEMGALKIDLKDALRMQTEHKLVNCFHWKDGTYSFRPMKDLPPGIERFDFSTSYIVYLGIKSSYTLEELQEKFSGFLDTRLREDKPPYSIEEMGLSPQEMETFHLINGKRTVKEILDANRLGLQETLGLLYALLIIEIARPLPKAPVEVAPATPTPPSGEALKKPRLSSEDMALKSTLDDVLSRSRGQNHFQLLGLSPGAAVEQVKKAYYQRAREYHPDRYFDKPDEVKALAHEIFTLITQAHFVLTNPEERKKFEEYLRTGKTEEDVAREAANILNAEVAYQKGLALLKKGNVKGAEEQLRTARELNPQGPEYHIYYGWALFKLASPGQVDYSRAKEAINKGLTLDSKVAQGFYFLGMIYKKEEKETEARGNFQKAIQCDPNHVDALREIRLMVMRGRKEDTGLFGKIFK